MLDAGRHAVGAGTSAANVALEVGAGDGIVAVVADAAVAAESRVGPAGVVSAVASPGSSARDDEHDPASNAATTRPATACPVLTDCEGIAALWGHDVDGKP
jgi:hypothetical protein